MANKHSEDVNYALRTFKGCTQTQLLQIINIHCIVFSFWILNSCLKCPNIQTIDNILLSQSATGDWDVDTILFT